MKRFLLRRKPEKMFSIDINKVKALQDIHWKWFWKRADKKIKLEYVVINQNKPKYKGVFLPHIGISNNLKNCFSKVIEEYSYKEFWEKFFKWREDDIYAILFASKDEMFEKIDNNKPFFQNYSSHIKAMNILFLPMPLKVGGKIRTIEDVVRETFGYKDFEDGGSPIEDGRSLRAKYGENWRLKRRSWNAYSFTTKMGVDVCPYCGRQYTFTLGDGDEVKNGRPQIDHYIPETEYPFLSCSLYNFIPSCASCNHQKSDKYNSKKVKWRNIPYPYEDFDAISKSGEKKLYDDVNFKAFYQFVKDESGEQTDELCYGIKLRKNGNKLSGEMKNADDAFHLEDLYNMHDLELNDLFSRYRIYNKSRLKNILTVIYSAQNTSNSRQFKSMISTESCRLKKVILGFPLGNDDRQYPLKKFKEDIVKQLDDTCKKMKKGQ